MLVSAVCTSQMLPPVANCATAAGVQPNANGFLVIKATSAIRPFPHLSAAFGLCVKNGQFVDRATPTDCGPGVEKRWPAEALKKVFVGGARFLSMRPIFKPSDLEKGKIDEPVAIEIAYCAGQALPQWP
jgi:hypothetical protein